MEGPILDIHRSTISEDPPSRRHSFTPAAMKRVDDRRRFSQLRPIGHSDSSLPFRERSASSRSGSSKGRYEDEITAPSDREIAVPMRQTFTTGRGGVGNRSHSVESARRPETPQAVLSQEQKILSQYKSTNVPTYRTGRGGAGAKGHVKARALFPNTETALAKERDIQYRWNLEKRMKGDAKTGRGGSGNYFKGGPSYEGRSSNSFDNSELRASSSRAGSRRENTPVIRESRFTYGFGYAPTIKYRSNSFSGLSLKGDDDQIPPIPHLEVGPASRIASPASSPLPTRSFTPSNQIMTTAAIPDSSHRKQEKSRVPNEVAPFDEPDWKASSKSTRHDPAVRRDKDTKKNDPGSLFKSFRRLRVGKTKDGKQATRAGGATDRPMLNIIRSQRDSILEIHANVHPPHRIIDVMETPFASTTSQTTSSAYPYPYLDQMLSRTQSIGSSSYQQTPEEPTSWPNTESGSESSHRDSGSISATNSISSTSNSVINSVTLELTSQASREWFPRRRRNSFWRTRPLPIPPT